VTEPTAVRTAGITVIEEVQDRGAGLVEDASASVVDVTKLATSVIPYS
jgi:hypothetical protein